MASYKQPCMHSGNRSKYVMPTTTIPAGVAYASLCVCALVCKLALGFILFELQHVKLAGQVSLDT